MTVGGPRWASMEGHPRSWPKPLRLSRSNGPIQTRQPRSPFSSSKPPEQATSRTSSRGWRWAATKWTVRWRQESAGWPTGRMAIYYGAADTDTALAIAGLDEILGFLRAESDG